MGEKSTDRERTNEKKMIDFGVVTFDSAYNKDYNRFHVRAEVELFRDILILSPRTSVWIPQLKSWWPKPADTRIISLKRKCIVEISHHGKRLEYGDNIAACNTILSTIREHSELKNNNKFLALCSFCKLPDLSAEKISFAWSCF